MEFRNDFGLEPGIPFGYMGKMVGRLELSKLPEMADAIGSSNDDDVRRNSRGAEKPSMKAAAEVLLLLRGPPDE